MNITINALDAKSVEEYLKANKDKLATSMADLKKAHPSRPDRQCDCLIWCGDDPAIHDGRADPCEHRIKIEQEAAEVVLWRLCRWKDVNKELPDADETVLVALIDNTEPIWLGYYDGERWLNVEGFPIKVSHWAPMPDAPEVRP